MSSIDLVQMESFASLIVGDVKSMLCRYRRATFIIIEVRGSQKTAKFEECSAPMSHVAQNGTSF